MKAKDVAIRHKYSIVCYVDALNFWDAHSTVFNLVTNYEEKFADAYA